MIPSVFIVDSAGRLIYKSGTEPIPPKFARLLRTNEPRHGLTKIGEDAYFVKMLSIAGQEYRFFLAYAVLRDLYETESAAEWAGDGLLDLSVLGSAPPKAEALASLIYQFYDCCPSDFQSRWVKTSLQGQIATSVSPSGFALALSLIVCMTAGDISLTAMQDADRVTVLCNGKVNREVELSFFRAFLQEVCGACGFGLFIADRGEDCRYVLELEPLDPAKLGLKAEDLLTESKNFVAYGAWFCG